MENEIPVKNAYLKPVHSGAYRKINKGRIVNGLIVGLSIIKQRGVDRPCLKVRYMKGPVSYAYLRDVTYGYCEIVDYEFWKE